jgi:PAS domain S-box-containing protein
MIDPDEIGRALLASVSDAVVASDREGRIILWNPGAERIFGFSAAEAVGQSLDIIIPEPYRARHWAGYDETIRTGTSRYGAGDILAVPGLRKDGTRNSIEFTIAVVKDAEGQVAAMAAVIRDVTKKFEDMKALKIQIAELKRKSGT